MKNLELWNQVCEVPESAKKTITGGRLSGKTDINPMWRIKVLTEKFGLCGIGWKYQITDKCLKPGADGVIAAFMDVLVYVKVDGEWSEGIPGTGGNKFVYKEKSGMYTSDECFKMCLTDAISVACKALGIGANVYWEKGKTKYTAKDTTNTNAKPQPDTKPANWETEREKPLGFGKHEKMLIKDLPSNYLLWASEKEGKLKDIAIKELEYRKQNAPDTGTHSLDSIKKSILKQAKPYLTENTSKEFANAIKNDNDIEFSEKRYKLLKFIAELGKSGELSKNEFVHIFNASVISATDDISMSGALDAYGIYFDEEENEYRRK